MSADALRKANRHRKQQVGDQTAELQRANEQLYAELAERKRAEEAVRECEKRYAQLLGSVTDYSYTVHVRDGRPVATVHGPGCAAVTGYTPEDYTADPYLWYRMVHEQDRDAVNDQGAKILSGEAALPLEHRIIHRDGSIRWVRNTPVSHYDEQGQLVAYDGLIANITERKRVEEDLRKSEEKYRTLFEESFDGLFVSSPGGKLLDANKKGVMMFGYDTKAEVLSLDLERDVYAYPPDRKRMLDIVDEQGTAEFEIVVKKRGGEQMVTHCALTAVKDKQGVITAYRGIIRDITGRKRVEEELARHRGHLEELVMERTRQLQESEQQYRQLFETMLQGVVYQAAGGKIVSMNPAAVRILGVAPSDLLGQTSVDRGACAIREDGSPFAGSEHPAMVTLQTGREVRDVVMGVYNPYEKDYRWINICAVPMFRPGADLPYQVYTLFDDITEDKRVADEIKRLNRDLQDRAVALEAANNELEAFAYSVSHDLRAPLRHIDGFLELLQKRTARSLDDQSRHYIDTVSNAARHMGTLIDDLLSFSRMGRQEISRRHVDLAALVQEAIRELEPETAGRNILWQIGDLPVVTGDRAILRIALINLISNALKYTRPRRQVEIEIGCTAENETEAVFFVRDNGVGFDMQYADRLFSVFRRLHRADEFEGTGIGLANVRRIINRHGGRTWAEGEVDHGAVFYFSLPRTTQG